MKTTTTSHRINLRILSVIVAAMLAIQFVSAQGWYNTGWLYRVPITITNSGGALTNFQVQVTLGSSFAWGHTQVGGADVRFTSGDGTSLIDFWIETWNSGTSASIWVEVPSVAASPETTTIYMYYGNSGVSSASNGFNTFEFFDDFNGGTIDAGRWTASGGTWTAVSTTQQDGTTGYVAQGDIPISQKHLLQSSYSGTDYVVECWGQQLAGRVWGLGVRATSNVTTYTLNLYEDLDATYNVYFYRWRSGYSTISVWNGAVGTINQAPPPSWYKLKVKAHGSLFDIYFNDNLLTTASNSELVSGSVGLFGEYDDNPQTAGRYQYNDIRVRKYASSEPSAIIGAEQTPTIIIDYTSTNVSCNGGSDGAIDLTVSGGTTPYTFAWTGPGGYTSDKEDIDGLITGTYSVIVRDNASHEAGRSIEISQPDPLLLSYSVTVAPTCTTPATILISATGGTPPYNGTGSFSQGLGTLTNYPVTDAKGCTNSIPVSVARSVEWYDPAWQYRDTVQVTNSGGEALSDYQVKVILNSEFNFSLASPDGSDIRFTSADGTTLISHWIESWSPSSGNAIIWVKIPSIPVTGTIIYIYYGNSAATSTSSGDNTFLFFDDFSSSVTQQPGYYTFGPASTIMVQNSAWGEGSAPHTLSVVRAPATGAYNNYLYYGYYGPQASGYIGIAGSNDLLTWTRFPYNPPPNSGINNPIFVGDGVRWPSVYKESENKYYMVHTMNYGSSYIVYRESSDGLSWSAPTTIVPYDVSNQNPSLFHDPVSGHYFLYWYRAANGWSIMAREATTVAGLVTATDVELLRSSTTLAAPQVLYYDNTYFLSTEIYNGEWQVRIYSGTNPLGPFTILPGNPVLIGGCACLFQHLFNGNIYEYYCKETSGTWTLDMRVVDPSTGRIMYEQGEIDPSKWTADGGTWTVQSATQPDGTTGHVAQGIMSANQILKSGFSGTDYTVEVYGRQISGRVWGLGVRAQSRQSIYSLSLYEDLDNNPIHNLHYYTWNAGTVTQDVYDDLGVINLNTWYKLKVKAHGNTFDLYFNDVLRKTATDNTWASGSAALFGESGTIAQFDNMLVRKYAAIEPSTSLGKTQFNGVQWTGEGGSSDWNNSANWFTCAVPLAANNVAIFDGPYDPVISGGTVSCNNLVIEPSASLTINADGNLTASSITINSSGTGKSGSLINLSSNSLIATYNRFLREEGNSGDKHLFASPVANQGIPEFITAFTAKIDSIRTWDEVNGVWPRLTDGTFASGTGYNVYQKANSDGLFSFTGTVVNTASFTATSPYELPYSQRGSDPYGNISPATINWTDGRGYIDGAWKNWGGGGWNLLGNPFTSAMDATLFVNNNSLSMDPWYQAIYVYEGINGVYKYAGAAVTPGYPVGADDHGSIIQAGQGFMVMANNNGATFNFTPAMQTHNTGIILLKSASTEDPWPGLQLKVKYGDRESLTTVVYNDAMSSGLDPGYDIGQLSSGHAVEVYTVLAEKDEGVNLARQALPVAGAEQIIVPVGIDTEKGGEVTFSAYTVPLGNYKFWLEDRVTGIFTDLTAKSYTVTLPAKTYGTGRFFIVASANTPTGIKLPEAEDTGVRIWTSNKKVIIRGEVNDKTLCEVYDLNGKLVLKRLLTGGELNTVDLPADTHGVYLVRVVDGVKITTRKVAVL